MTLTRDAWLLWLAFFGVVLGHLAVAGNPMLWDFQEWVKLGLLIVGWGTGKLQTSPLRGENDPSVKRDRKKGETILGSAGYEPKEKK